MLYHHPAGAESISAPLTVTVCSSHSEDGFSEDSYKAVWTFLFQAAGSCPRAHPGVRSGTGGRPAFRHALKFSPSKGAEVATAAQVEDARTLTQGQRVGGGLYLHLCAAGGPRWRGL